MIEVSLDHGGTYCPLSDTAEGAESMFRHLAHKEWPRHGIPPDVPYADLARGEFRSPAGYHYRRVGP